MSSPSLDTRVTFFQLLLLVLSVVLLCSLLLDSVVTLPAEASRILQGFDTVVCVLFFLDFLIRFRGAERKLLFLKWGWIDLIASIPNLDILRWGRLVRIIRVIRVLRAVRSFQRIVTIILQHRTRNGVASIIVTAVLLVVFTSVGILVCETSPSPPTTILNAEDAIWWSVSTITTVGYGDKYPVTTEGRIIAMLLMMAGLGLFGTLSGVIASHLLGAEPHSEDTSQQVLKELRELRAQVDDLANRQKAAPRDSDSADGGKVVNPGN